MSTTNEKKETAGGTAYKRSRNKTNGIYDDGRRPRQGGHPSRPPVLDLISSHLISSHFLRSALPARPFICLDFLRLVFVCLIDGQTDKPTRPDEGTGRARPPPRHPLTCARVRVGLHVRDVLHVERRPDHGADGGLSLVGVARPPPQPETSLGFHGRNLHARRARFMRVISCTVLR